MIKLKKKKLETKIEIYLVCSQNTKIPTSDQAQKRDDSCGTLMITIVNRVVKWLCTRSWLSGNLGKTALRLLEIMPMYYDTSLKTSRIDLSALFSPRPLSRNGNFFFLFQGFGRKRDGRERRNPQGHGRHYACTN